jgi:hypothetical protein
MAGVVYRMTADANPGSPEAWSMNVDGLGCVVADETRIAYADSSGLVQREPGGNALTASPPPNDGLMDAIAIGGAHAYYTWNVGGKTHVGHVAVGSSDTTEIAAVPGIIALAADARGVYWSVADGEERHLEGCSDPICTGGPIRLSQGLPFPTGLLVGDQSLYYYDGSKAQVFSVPR